MLPPREKEQWYASLTILPRDLAHRLAYIDTYDPAFVVDMVDRQGLGEVDVLRDGEYSFSCKPNDGGHWLIFQRSE